MAKRTYGEVAANPVGTTLRDRIERSTSRVHGPRQAGIWGGVDGAESIVLSGKYVDNEDHGDVITYTDQGGNAPNIRRQIADQELKRGNGGLARAQREGTPDHVVRGARGDSRYSPRGGYRYGGLSSVLKYWDERGRAGYRIWRFRLSRYEP